MAYNTKIKVGVINASKTILHDSAQMAKLNTVVDALNIQVRDDFFPIWGKNAEIELVENDPAQTKPRLTNCQKWWWLVLADTSDEAGYYGYHDFTCDGMPLGKVFVTTATDAKRDWTVTASHELLEMLTDPWLNISVFREDEDNANKGWFYAFDICDPCQEGSYWINPLKEETVFAAPQNNTAEYVAVSNFVYPSWFGLDHKDCLPYDYLKSMTEPFELLSGGYISLYDAPLSTGWYQKYRDGTDISRIYNRNPDVGSRRQRRKRRMSGNNTPPPRPSRIPRIPG